MNWAKIFALVMVAQDVAVSIFYMARGDWKHAAYWVFCAGALYCVTV